MDPIPLPPPTGGVNQKVPKFSLQSPYAEKLLNWNISTTVISTRKADGLFKEETTSPNPTIMAISAREEPFSSGCILVMMMNSVTREIQLWRVDSLGVTLILFGAFMAVTPVSFSTSYFRGYNYFFWSDGTNQYALKYDGTGVTVAGYTFGGPAILAYGGAAVYKNRHYIPKAKSAGFYYSDIDAVTGACFFTDLSSVTNSPAYLINIATFTLADTVAAQEVIAFIFSDGLVLFYTGSFPGGADWTKAGVAKISNPYNLDSGTNYQGDYVIANEQGIVSLRDLFLKGSEQAASLTVNSNVNEDWQRFVALYPPSTGYVVGALFDNRKQRLLFDFPLSFEDPRGSPYGINWFILNIDSDTLLPWNLHECNGLLAPSTCRRAVVWNGGIYYITLRQQAVTGAVLSGFRVIKKEELATNLYDVGSGEAASGLPIRWDYISAPVANGRLYVQKCDGLDVLLTSDVAANIKYELIPDFGAYTSNGPPTLPQNTTALQKAFVNIGIEASFIQYRIYGDSPNTTDAVGMTLYGVNFWVEQGRMPR